MTLHWLNPALLWALPLALLPLLLLLRRQETEPASVPFAATPLLERVAAQAARRQRRRLWWLLLLRIMVLAALLLAFARPVWSPGRAAEGGLAASGEAVPVSTIAVDVRAEPPEFLEAALGRAVGSGPTTGCSLIFLGERAAPVRGLELRGLQAGEVTISAGPYYHPALEFLNRSGGDDLRDIRVRRWWRVAPAGGMITLARLDNGDPFLVEILENGSATLVCTVAPDPEWTDLPLNPLFVPLVRELVRHLKSGAWGAPATGDQRPAGRDLSGILLALALALALLEFWPGGMSAWKLLPLGLLALVLLHPHVSWRGSRRSASVPLFVVDRTQSMQFRATDLDNLVARLPAGDVTTLTGQWTDLAQPLAGPTLRPAVLLSDGQHNLPARSPAAEAARRGVPVLTVAVGDPALAPDRCLVWLRAPQFVFGDEPGQVEFQLAVTGGPTTGLPVRVLAPPGDGSSAPPNVLMQTNLAAGRSWLLFPASHSGSYRLEVAPQPGEVTTANNERSFRLTRIPQPIRVRLQHEGPTWEYRHARQALATDPGVELVADPAAAEVTLSAAGELWRLRRFSDAGFVQIWRRAVRQEWQRQRRAPLLVPVPESPEMDRLARNDDLLREIARVSGGEFFTADTIDQLPAALAQAATERRQLDLRDSVIALLVLLAGFMGCWALDRRSSEEGTVSPNPG